MLFGDVDCRNCILVVLVTSTAVATTALVETVQTQHFVNDWVQTASHMWNTQLRIHTRFESELAATKNTLLWEIYGGTDTEPTLTSNSLFATGMLLITVLLLLNIMTTHTWDLVKKKKNHLQGAWSNVSLDVAHLQEQVTINSQAHLQATPASEVLTKIEESFQKHNPLNEIKGFGGGLQGTRVLMLVFYSFS